MSVTREELEAVKAEILGAIAAESHSTVELGITAKGEPTWTIKARAHDVNLAAFESQQIHEAFAARYGRGQWVDGTRPVSKPAGNGGDGPVGEPPAENVAPTPPAAADSDEEPF